MPAPAPVTSSPPCAPPPTAGRLPTRCCPTVLTAAKRLPAGDRVGLQSGALLDECSEPVDGLDQVGPAGQLVEPPVAATGRRVAYPVRGRPRTRRVCRRNRDFAEPGRPSNGLRKQAFAVRPREEARAIDRQPHVGRGQLVDDALGRVALQSAVTDSIRNEPQRAVNGDSVTPR